MGLDVRHSRLARLLDGIGGQLFTRGTLILFQLVTVPLLISAWGVEQYGAWLALTALAGFAANANFGLLNAFNVEITTVGGGGDRERLRTTVHSANVMLVLLLGPALLLLCAAGWYLPVASWLKLEAVTRLDVFQVLLLVSVQLFADTLRSISASVIVAQGRYGLPNILAGGLRLVEIAGLAVIVLALGGTIVHAAALSTAIALVSLVVHRAVAHRMTDGMLRGGRRFDRALVRSLLPASLGSFILSFGVNTVTVHGTRLALSAFLGPQALAAFAVTMTAAKMIDQLNVSFVGVLQPEFSRLRGSGSPADTERLVMLGSQTALASFLLLAAGVLAVGPVAFELWTHGTIAFSYPLAMLLLAGILLMQTGKTTLYYLVGNNAVLGLGVGALASALAGLGLSIVAMPHWGVYGAAAGFVAGEALMLATVIACAAHRLGVPPFRLLRRLMSLGELPAALSPVIRRVLAR